MSKWRDQLEGWLKTIEVKGSVLDIGGAQKPVKGRTKTWEAKEYIIADIAGGFDIFWDVQDGIPGQLFPFDISFMLETLMYCVDPVKALHNACFMTSHEIFISNPLEGYPETKPAGTDMVRLMPNWFDKALADNGFKIEEMKIVQPIYEGGFDEEIRTEGYKVSRRHASGILIHATRI